MRDEARLLGWLRHKNIVDVMDLTLIDGRCAVIMEYLDAVDTKVVINHCAQSGSRIPIRSALEMCAAVASALDAAYNRPPYAGEKPLRVIHRDIKPSNIMLDDSGVVKVLDFGVARAEFDERESKTQEMAFGSLEYMPPERLFFEPESPASDIYSLGATLYELLALEKFGKAKLRPKEHEKFFEDRFDLLLDRYPLHDEAEKLLHELLMDMLEFDEPERPSAADCVARMRAFARRIPEHPLEEWSEAVVPGLLRKSGELDTTATPGSLVGSVLTEDARALDQRSIWDENTGMSTRAMDLSALDDEMTGALADDARWKALKQAHIDELAKNGELGPVQPPRADPPPPPANVRSVLKGPGLSTTGAPSMPRQKVPAPPAISATPTPAPTQRFKVPPEFRQYNQSQPSRPPTSVEPRPSRSAAPAPPRREGKKGGMVMTLGLMFLFGSGLGLIAFGLVVLVFALTMMTTQSPVPGTPVAPIPAPVLPAPLPDPLPVPDRIPEPEDPEAAPEPHSTFFSGRSNTEKMKVSCTKGKGQGVDSAVVEGEDLGTCRVQAVTGAGERLSTRVKNVEPREYLCFAGDTKTCK